MKTTMLLLSVLLSLILVPGCSENDQPTAIVAPYPNGSNTLAFETLVKNAGVVQYASDILMRGTVSYRFNESVSEVDLEGPAVDLAMQFNGDLLFDSPQIPTCCVTCSSCDRMCEPTALTETFYKSYAVESLGAGVILKVQFRVHQRTLSILQASLEQQ